MQAFATSAPHTLYFCNLQIRKQSLKKRSLSLNLILVFKLYYCCFCVLINKTVCSGSDNLFVEWEYRLGIFIMNFHIHPTGKQVAGHSGRNSQNLNRLVLPRGSVTYLVIFFVLIQLWNKFVLAIQHIQFVVTGKHKYFMSSCYIFCHILMSIQFQNFGSSFPWSYICQHLPQCSAMNFSQ